MPRYRIHYSPNETVEREAQLREGCLVEPKRYDLPYLDPSRLQQHPQSEDIKHIHDDCHKSILNFERWLRQQEQARKRLQTAMTQPSGNVPSLMETLHQLGEDIKTAKQDMQDYVDEMLWQHPEFRDCFVSQEQAELIIPYAEADRWPQHAQLAAQHQIKPAEFTQLVAALDGYQAAQQAGHDTRTIPDIGIIDGAAFGMPDAYLTLLAKDDPRLMRLGKIINENNQGSSFCCDNLDRTGNAQNLAQIHSPNLATLVLQQRSSDVPDTRHDRILGKSTLWLGQYDGAQDKPATGICLNGWYGDKRPQVKPLLTEAAQRMLSQRPDIQKVTLAGAFDLSGSFPSVAHESDLLRPLPDDVASIARDYHSQSLILSQRMLESPASQRAWDR